MNIEEMGMTKRAVNAILSKGIETGEALVEYISVHPGWCHSEAYPDNIRGIGEKTAKEILDRILECRLADATWHRRQCFFTTNAGYQTLWIHVGKTRKRWQSKEIL